jgi:hypothetical protein
MGDGPLGSARRQYGATRASSRWARVPRWHARRGPAARASRRWGLARTDTETAEHAACGAGTSGRAPARWRRSRARSCCVPAGQRDCDCMFLQKFELCDKNGRYKSCRWDIPLQHLQRSSYVFLDGLSRNAKWSSGFAERWWIVKTAADQVFHPFPPKIWNAVRHESCVPRKTGWLLYW